MIRPRGLVVTATITLTIILSLAALVRDRLLWPFSHYPMYSGLYGPRTAITRAVGVDAAGKEWPLPSRVEPSGLHLHIIADHLRRQPDAEERLTRVAGALGREYERLRTIGVVEGASLAGVRIYRDSIQTATKPHARSTTLLARWSER